MSRKFLSMDCKKAQRLFDDLTGGRLSETIARQIQRHVQDCTDCRVAYQRAARLQQMLTLKRYERPSSNYFDRFLGEFHQRLEAATAPHVSWWDRIVDNLAIEPVRTWRYGFTGAVGLALTVTMLWRGFSSPSVNSAATAQQTSLSDPTPIFASSTLPASHSTPRTIAATLPVSARPTRDEPGIIPSAGNVVIIPVAAHNDTSAPRYVLDRIGVTPASYEVASIHF